MMNRSSTLFVLFSEVSRFPATDTHAYIHTDIDIDMRGIIMGMQMGTSTALTDSCPHSNSYIPFSGVISLLKKGGILK